MYLHTWRRPQVTQVQLVSQLVYICPSLFCRFLSLYRDLICYNNYLLLSIPPTSNWATSSACCVAIRTTEPGATNLSHDSIYQTHKLMACRSEMRTYTAANPAWFTSLFVYICMTHNYSDTNFLHAMCTVIYLYLHWPMVTLLSTTLTEC